MRLGQLSRKIGVQPSKISDFLEEQNYTLDAGSNTKLSLEQEELIKTKFKYVEEVEEPVLVEEELTQEVDQPTELISESAVEEQTKESIEVTTSTLPSEQALSPEPVLEEATLADGAINETSEVTPEKEIELTNEGETTATQEIDQEESSRIVESSQAKEQSDDEVIRAPKLKLEGLKVVGKIDLPEPKVKEEPEATAKEDAPAEPIKEKPVRKKNNHRLGNRKPKKRVLTLEEKAAKEKREKQRRDKKIREKQKQLKTAHYEAEMRKRKPASTQKSKRKVQKLQQQDPAAKTTNKPAPKTLFGKFLRWLNT